MATPSRTQNRETDADGFPRQCRLAYFSERINVINLNHGEVSVVLFRCHPVLRVDFSMSNRVHVAITRCEEVLR